MRPWAAAIFPVAAPAWADDRSAGVVPSPFRAEPAGGAVPTAIGIVIGRDEVRIALGVTARAGAAIRLDLPRSEWLGGAETYPDRHFPELKIDADGRIVPPVDDFVATARGRDVAPALRAAGVDPFAIAETPPFVAALPGRQAAFDALAASGAVSKAPEGFLAGWSASRIIRVTPGAARMW